MMGYGDNLSRFSLGTRSGQLAELYAAGYEHSSDDFQHPGAFYGRGVAQVYRHCLRTSSQPAGVDTDRRHAIPAAAAGTRGSSEPPVEPRPKLWAAQS